MASGVDTTKVRKSFHRAAKDPAVERLAVAVYQKALRDGLRQRMFNTSVPNSEQWLDRKRSAGWGQRPMVRTGKLLAAVTNNPPVKVGTRRGVRLGVNWRSAVAFVIPRVFTDHKGKRLPAKLQDKIFRTHRYGSAIQKIASSWEKLRADRSVKGRYRALLHGSFEGYLSGAAGPSKAARRAALEGHMGIPARPVFAWDRAWSEEMAHDVDEAIAEVLKGEGLDAKRG